MSSNDDRITPAPAGEVGPAPVPGTAPVFAPAPAPASALAPAPVTEASPAPVTSASPPAEAEALQDVTHCDDAGGDADGLSLLQFRAIDLLVLGENDSAVARELGVSRMTLWRWQTKHAGFKAELARRRRLIWNTTADHYRRLLARSADLFERMLSDRCDVSRYRAAYAELQMAGRFQPASEPEPDSEMTKPQ